MYYGKQSNSYSNYYNAYKNNSYKSNNENDYLTIILKILIIILLLGVLFVTYISIVYKAEPVKTALDKRVQTVEIVKIEPIKEIPKEKKIVLTKSKTDEKSLTPKEIASIIEAVMSQINKTKTDDESYRKKLVTQDVDLIDSVNPKKVEKNSISLKDTDYYNKVVIKRPNSDVYSNDTLSQLSSEISNIIESSESDEESLYTKEITREVKSRSDEMRFIIVEEGDTLGKIAYRVYGNYDAYDKISQANPEVIYNPDQIYPGQRLRIPI